MLSDGWGGEGEEGGGRREGEGVHACAAHGRSGFITIFGKGCPSRVPLHSSLFFTLLTFSPLPLPSPLDISPSTKKKRRRKNIKTSLILHKLCYLFTSQKSINQSINQFPLHQIKRKKKRLGVMRRGGGEEERRRRGEKKERRGRGHTGLYFSSINFSTVALVTYEHILPVSIVEKCR